MPYCTYSETARILGYSSRSTLYKVRKDGWLRPYKPKPNPDETAWEMSVYIESKKQTLPL